MSNGDISRDVPQERAGATLELMLPIDGQSEAVQVEAAEFLVATRAQQERRLRIAKDLDALRILGQPTH